MRTQWFCLLLVTVCSHAAAAEQPGSDPLKRLLVSPEAVVHHGVEIGLSQEQIADFRRRLEQAGRQASQVQQQVNSAMGRLTQLLSADKVDEDAAVKQLDELLALEKEHKQLHLRILIQIRNELTPEQRQAATKISQRTQSNGGLEQRLKSKLSQIEKVVQQRSAAGQPPFEAVGLMQKFPELMQSGQVNQAEALLDRVIAILGENVQEQPGRGIAERIQRIQRRAQQMQQNGEDVTQVQDLMTQLSTLMGQGNFVDAEKLVSRALKLVGEKAEDKAADDTAKPRGDQSRRTPSSTLPKQYSAKEVREEIEVLAKQDVAWRKIQWKTCLLDGLKASREQNKPIMLWIFIDRPIDDERC